jgi:hypothetical protein
MGSELRAPSPAMRLCRAPVRLASSAGAAEEEFLQPERARVKRRAAAAARMAWVVRRLCLTYILFVSSIEPMRLTNNVKHGTAIRCKAS